MISLASSRESRALDLYLSYPKQVSQKNASFVALEETFFVAAEETFFVAPEETFFVDPRRNLLRYAQKNPPSLAQKKLPSLAQKKLSLSLLRTSLFSSSSSHFFTKCMSSCLPLSEAKLGFIYTSSHVL